MVRYLRSDATSLSDEDIWDIINAKDLMNRASEVMAKKYKISPQQVYQIWRKEHPPIAPMLANDAADESSAPLPIKDDDLKAFYERETQQGQKNIERSLLL